MTVVFAGDISLDLSMSAPRVPGPDEKVHCTTSFDSLGGVVTNAAVAHVRAGGDARLIVQTGSDFASRAALDYLADQSMTVANNVVEGALCRVVTIIEPHGEKRLLLYPGVSLYPDAPFLAELDLACVELVHTACYGPGWATLLERCRERDIAWSLDLEPASFECGLDALAAAIDGAGVVFCNDRAADMIGPDAVETLISRGAKSVVRTLGPRGASLHSRAADPIHVLPPPGIPIIDTTGAGDCLAGWYLAELVERTAPQVALARAVLAATVSCSSIGAQSGYPTRNDIINRERKEAQ